MEQHSSSQAIVGLPVAPRPEKILRIGDKNLRERFVSAVPVTTSMLREHREVLHGQPRLQLYTNLQVPEAAAVV